MSAMPNDVDVFILALRSRIDRIRFEAHERQLPPEGRGEVFAAILTVEIELNRVPTSPTSNEDLKRCERLLHVLLNDIQAGVFDE
ncbi:hypothetical protein DES52_11667 [Deinococcus yavapaiensis KR-236]|uniref:Uncharacterized protein n=2 Tax=Deinococcus TaxID=1298 RepID=A0A318S740_9DEIO|nr:hypothetical protein DES52_11667 [Deinococcus yavapaiensis KR-236]